MFKHLPNYNESTFQQNKNLMDGYNNKLKRNFLYQANKNLDNTQFIKQKLCLKTKKFLQATLIQPEEEEGSFSNINNNPNKGSIFAPSDIGSNGQKKEVAKPYAQIQVKLGQKDLDQLVVQQQEKQKNKVADKNDIWDIDEVLYYNLLGFCIKQMKNIRDFLNRISNSKQLNKFGTEDVFGGWSGIDPSSTKCQGLLIKIKLPDTKLSEINLEVMKQQIIMSSTQYYLDFILPYPVNEKMGKAKFVSDKSILELELPIIREELY